MSSEPAGVVQWQDFGPFGSGEEFGRDPEGGRELLEGFMKDMGRLLFGTATEGDRSRGRNHTGICC